MKRIPILICLLALTGCSDLPQPSLRDALVIGQTDAGANIYRFQLSRANALGVSPVSEVAIATRAREICPAGYRELARSGEATRRNSGVVYTDVFVTLVCA